MTSKDDYDNLTPAQAHHNAQKYTDQIHDHEVVSWEFRTPAYTDVQQGNTSYKSVGINIRNMRFPSRMATLSFVFQESYGEHFLTYNEVKKKMIAIIGRKAEATNGPTEHFVSVNFFLKKTEDFSKVAVEIGKLLFKKFKIKRTDIGGSANFSITRTPYVKSPNDGWIPYSKHLAKEFGLSEG